MDSLPQEIYVNIFRYTSIKDIIISNQISKFFNILLNDHMNDIIYEMANNTTKLDNLLYNSYRRGKSYSKDQLEYVGIEINFDIKDSIFEFSEFEHILLYHKDKLISHEPYIIIVTLNNYGIYTIYYFRSEVSENERYTPGDYGWDQDDLNVLVLKNTYKYDNIKDIKNIEIHYVDYYNEDYTYEFNIIHKILCNF
jgi:hypothetical protein